jgi:hypothetical protein
MDNTETVATLDTRHFKDKQNDKHYRDVTLLMHCA